METNDSNEEHSSLINDITSDRIAPKDRFGLVKLSFALIGLSQLIPWNFLITANEYWNYKFRDINESNYETIGNNVLSMDSEMTSLQKYFESYLSIATNLPFLLILVLNAFYGHKLGDDKKNLWSFALIVIIFIINTIFVKINTDNYGQTFFGITILLVIILSTCAAFLQSSISGIASIFPSECMHAMVTGQAVSGLFAALAQILSLSGQLKVTESAFYYFLMADITLIISLVLFLYAKQTNYYKYHKQRVNQSRQQLNSFTTNVEQNYLTMFSSIWPHLMSAMFVFWITLSVFPSISVLVIPQNPYQTELTGKYFTPLTCFLLFNLSDFMGRFAGRFCPIPSRHKLLLLLTTFLRIIIIPLLMLCNAIPRSHLPVIFKSEVYYILFMTALGFSNGFVLINIMISGPTFVRDEYKEKAGNFLVVFLGFGLTLGSFSSNILLRFL